jgi:hypothetical protein
MGNRYIEQRSIPVLLNIRQAYMQIKIHTNTEHIYLASSIIISTRPKTMVSPGKMVNYAHMTNYLWISHDEEQIGTASDCWDKIIQ